MKNPSSQKSRVPILVLAMLLLCFRTVNASTPDPAGPSPDLSTLRSLPVLDGGRFKPLDTLCRESLLVISDDDSVNGQDAVRVVFSLAFEPEKWRDRPILALSFHPHRARLGLPPKQRLISYNQLRGNAEFRKMMEELDRAATDPQNADDSREMNRLATRFSTIEAVFSHRLFRLVPIAGHPEKPWLSPADLDDRVDPDRMIRKSFTEVGRSFVTANSLGLARSSKELSTLLARVDPSNYPDERTMDLEVLYNFVRPFRVSAYLYVGASGLLVAHLLGGSLVSLWAGLGLLICGVVIGFLHAIFPLLIVAGLALCGGRLMRGARGPIRIAAMLLVMGWLLQTGGIGARTVISGRAPIANMFESMVFLAWGAVTFGLGFSFFHGVSYFGTASSGVAIVMLLAAENCFDPFIAPLVPVLRSYWLWAHVSVVMLGYAGLFLAITLAHMRLLLSFLGESWAEQIRTLDQYLHRSLQVGCACLGAGIVLGGIWADYSWGRYWGWDPKETWSLITFLCFLALLHGRLSGWLSGTGIAAGSVLGVFPLLMTYYGVNFLLVGLHSYAGAAQQAGSTFVEKLLGVPVWLSLFSLAEIVFLQLVDAVVLRKGVIVGITLTAQTVFFCAVHDKISWWPFGAVAGQAALALWAWTRPQGLHPPREAAPPGG